MKVKSERYRTALLVLLSIIFVFISITFFSERPQVLEIPKLISFSDPSLQQVAMLAAYIEERNYELNNVRITPSIKYMFLAKRLYEIENGTGFSYQLFPEWLSEYGILPDAVMPTDIDLLSIGNMTKTEIDKIMTKERIDSAKKYFIKYVGEKFFVDRLMIYSSQDLVPKSIFDSVTRCTQSTTDMLCYRKDLINFLVQENNLVIFKSDDGQYETALMLDSYFDDNEYYYKILTQRGLQIISYKQLLKMVVGTPFPKKHFEFFDNARIASDKWLSSEALNAPSNRKSLLLFMSRTCLYCKQFLADAATDKEMQKLLSGYRLIKIKKETSQDLIKKYQINGYPRFIILDSHLRELKRKIGYDGKDNIVKFLKEGS